MRIGQLRAMEPRELARRYGRLGARLAQLARAEDDRRVDPAGRARSISAETTFASDESDATALAHVLRPLSERVSERLKQGGFAAHTVTLKLKTADFRLRTRSRRLSEPTQLADTLYRTACTLLVAEADGTTRFRLIGIGVDNLTDNAVADLPTLFDGKDGRPRRLEQAIDELRSRYGVDNVHIGPQPRPTTRSEPSAQEGGRTTLAPRGTVC
jgi:DNA polymerase-4